MPPTNQNDLLARLDERMGHVIAKLENIEEKYVTRDEFAPVRAIVFGAVALILLAFMGAILYLTGWKG